VSGFEAVSLPVDTRGRGTPIRDTWIGVPENNAARGRVYFFNLMAAGAEAEQGQMVYEKMLASMRLDAKILHERLGPDPSDCSR
jgi:hypothetical protein